jgi:site-specific DNA-methyltransferase (adenine-specific)
MVVENMPVSALVRYNNNAKEHTPEQIAGIAKSIKEFGFRQPIAVDRDNVIVIGHGRLLAAKELGLKEVPVTVIDDLTDDEINALRLVDNRLNESAWDFSALEAELMSIDSIDMTDFGFEPISEEEVENVARQPETPQERAWRERVEEYTPILNRPEYNTPAPPREAPDAWRAGNTAHVEYTRQMPLQATADYRDTGHTDVQGRTVVGEQSLIEAEPERIYRYTCPRCKHRFN